MKIILVLALGLFSGVVFAGVAFADDTNNIQTKSLDVIERLGDIERIDVTAPVDIVEDGYDDQDVMRILEEGETIEAESAKAS